MALVFFFIALVLDLLGVKRNLVSINRDGDILYNLDDQEDIFYTHFPKLLEARGHC